MVSGFLCSLMDSDLKVFVCYTRRVRLSNGVSAAMFIFEIH